MPMQFGKVTLETPQEVQARLQRERRAMSASGNVSAINQATISNVLDGLFGNPEVKSARTIQGRLQAAQAGLSPQEGDDDITTEMRRVAAMRDAIQDLDPALVNEMTTQLLQLGTIKAERSKLQAEQQLAQRRDLRGTLKLESDLATSATTRAENLAQLQAAAGKGINYWRRRGNEIQHIALPEQNSLERRRLLAEGWLEGTGPTSEAEAGSIVNPPTKAVQTDLQTTLLSAQNQLDQMATIAQKFEPEFLELPTQLLMKGAGALDKIGLGETLPAELAGRRERFIEFRRNSVDAFNQYIKSITGAAMAVTEAERIQKGFPDAEKDDPREFINKMRGTARQILGIQKRSAQTLQQGMRLNPEELSHITTPPVSDAEVDAFLSRFGIPARSGSVVTSPSRESAPNSTRQQRIDAILNGE